MYCNPQLGFLPVFILYSKNWFLYYSAIVSVTVTWQVVSPSVPILKLDWPFQQNTAKLWVHEHRTAFVALK